jgi:hypothetical protein
MIFSSFSVSRYWERHLSISGRNYKEESAINSEESFVDLIIINFVVPIQFAYAKTEE